VVDLPHLPLELPFVIIITHSTWLELMELMPMHHLRNYLNVGTFQWVFSCFGKIVLKLANSKAEYDKVGDEIYRLRDEKQKVQLDIIGRGELKKRIEDMGDFLKEQPTAITEFDEPLVQRLIEKSPSTKTNSPWNSSPA